MRLRNSVTYLTDPEDDDFVPEVDRAKSPKITVPKFPGLLESTVVPFEPRGPPAAFPSLPLTSNPGRSVAPDDSPMTPESPQPTPVSGINVQRDSAHPVPELLLEKVRPKPLAEGPPSGPERKRGETESRPTWGSLPLSLQYHIFTTLSQRYDSHVLARMLRLVGEELFEIQKAVNLRSLHPSSTVDLVVQCCANVSLLEFRVRDYAWMDQAPFENYWEYFEFANNYELAYPAEVLRAEQYLSLHSFSPDVVKPWRQAAVGLPDSDPATRLFGGEKYTLTDEERLQRLRIGLGRAMRQAPSQLFSHLARNSVSSNMKKIVSPTAKRKNPLRNGHRPLASAVWTIVSSNTHMRTSPLETGAGNIAQNDQAQSRRVLIVLKGWRSSTDPKPTTLDHGKSPLYSPIPENEDLQDFQKLIRGPGNCQPRQNISENGEGPPVECQELKGDTSRPEPDAQPALSVVADTDAEILDDGDPENVQPDDHLPRRDYPDKPPSTTLDLMPPASMLSPKITLRISATPEKSSPLNPTKAREKDTGFLPKRRPTKRKISVTDMDRPGKRTKALENQDPAQKSARKPGSIPLQKKRPQTRLSLSLQEQAARARFRLTEERVARQSVTK